jgi:hypothetical protein
VKLNPAGAQLVEQPGHGRGDFAVARDEHGPLQILPELARADAPPVKLGSCGGADLDYGPVPR